MAQGLNQHVVVLAGCIVCDALSRCCGRCTAIDGAVMVLLALIPPTASYTCTLSLMLCYPRC